MAVTETYTRKEDGKVYLRHIETRTDITGTEFTLRDKEVEFNHRKHLPQLETNLADIRVEIAELEAEESRLVNKISAVKVAIG
jgi:hypothetical protein